MKAPLIKFRVPAAARPDWRKAWADRKAAWVESVWIMMMRDPSFAPLFLYCRPTAGKAWGELITVREGADPPAGTFLVTAERVPPGSKDRIAHWLEPLARQLPVLPPEED